MTLNQKYKDYFRKKSVDELYDLINKLKLFVDVAIQDSISGTPEERIKSYNMSLLKLRDALIFELSILNHNTNLLRIEKDLEKLKEINQTDQDSKKNLNQEMVLEKDQ
jgi:hypothetical protein